MRAIDVKLRECLDDAVQLHRRALNREADALKAWSYQSNRDPLGPDTHRTYEAWLAASRAERAAARYHQDMRIACADLPPEEPC